MPRIVDDVTLAQRFAALGMDGFILKSHYTSTAERASVVRAAVPGSGRWARSCSTAPSAG